MNINKNRVSTYLIFNHMQKLRNNPVFWTWRKNNPPPAYLDFILKIRGGGVFVFFFLILDPAGPNPAGHSALVSYLACLLSSPAGQNNLYQLEIST